MVIFTSLNALGQINVAQSNFTGLVVPKAMSSGSTTRLPVLFRATISSLNASTTYRYYTQGAIGTQIGTTNSGAGNPMFINSSGTTFTYSTAPSVTTAGGYETFTTDANGSYTGWFGFVYTNNANYTAGNVIYPTLTIANSSGTIVNRRALDLGITVYAFGTASANCSFIQSTGSSATAKNFVALYENTTGTGRPVAVTCVENISAAIGSVVTGYSTNAGAWNAIIPNNLTTGVKRIEQIDVASGSVVGCAVSSNGSWSTGNINTVNATSGTTAMAISSTDAPLNTCSSITVTGSVSALSTTSGTASSNSTFVVSASNLVNNLVITAPSGFEISSTSGGTSGFSSSLTLTPSNNGSLANTTIHVRIAASTTLGTYSGNIVCSSSPATTRNVAIPASTVTNPTPILTTLSPSSVTAGAASFTLTVDGSSFVSTSVINWNGATLSTTFVNSTQLTANVSSTLIANAGTVTVTVSTPSGGTSSTSNFTINPTAGGIIAVSGTLSTFISVAGSPSSSQSYSVSGTNLSTDLTVSGPANYEFSLNGSTWSSSLTLSPVSNTISSTTVYVRLNASLVDTYSGNISNVSSGAVTQTLAVTGNALNQEPSSIGAVAFSGNSSSSITANFTGGNGSSRIVVVSTAPVSYQPVDGATSTGVNANYLLATDKGAGDKIVYDGTGNTVSVVGLSPLTTYYFAVYEYNGSGVFTNYLTSSSTIGNASTISSEPTLSSTLALNRLSLDSMIVNLTGGNGARRMIVVNSGSAVSFSPLDGTAYIGANENLSQASNLGGGLLVYDGTGSSCVIKGFSPSTTYYLAVFEYNGSGSSINYLPYTGNFSVNTWSYIPYTNGTAYTQSFDGMPAAGLSSANTTGFGLGPYYLSTPPVNATGLSGWQYTSLGGSNNDIRIFTDNGSATTGANMIFRTSSTSTDKAMGSLASSAITPAFGAIFTNNGNQPLTNITISYVGEQWRVGGSGNLNVLQFNYQLGATNIKNGNWIPETGLNFLSPVTTVSTAGASLDGNLSANRTIISKSFELASPWLPGQQLAIRWNDANETGNDDGLGIDSLTFNATPPQDPTQQDSMISFSSVFTTNVNVNWNAGNGAKRILVMNTTNNFTAPVNGVDYTSLANSTYANNGQQITYVGTGTSVTINGLTQGTTYYFRVYSFNGFSSATVYNTNTALDNPNSQITTAVSDPTKLVISSINNGVAVQETKPFSVKIQTQDADGNIQPVTTSTTIDLSVFSGLGVIGGVTSGVIPSGSSELTITGVTYDVSDYGVQLNASATAGMVLSDGQSAPFDVYKKASQLVFVSPQPSTAVINASIDTLRVITQNDDLTTDIYYSGNITLAIYSGSGILTGTLTQPVVNGIASFGGLSINNYGNYILQATSGNISGNSATIIITGSPKLTSLVFPKYMGSKTGAATNSARTPVAFCMQIDSLVPNTTYNIAAKLALYSDALNDLGAGNIWNGTSYSGSLLNAAFTTNANGSSGPFWVFIQPSSNGNRFDAGQYHRIRLNYSQGTVNVNTYAFESQDSILSLDIANTARTAATTDDGAFMVGSLDSCISGKYILVYDNTNGIGQPLFAYPSVNTGLTQTNYNDLSPAVDSVYRNLSEKGTFAAIIPIGQNNLNGVRRIEARDAQNNILNYSSDNDGIWPSGANTTTVLRRGLVRLAKQDASLNTITSLIVTTTNPSCFGALNGSLVANVVSSQSTINYVWNNNQNLTGATLSGVGAGNYSVVATDGIGCIKSASAILTQPSQPAAPSISCYETAVWNSTTCQYDISGTQPASPTGLACYEISNFNTTTCSWDVTGTIPTTPTLACYETATFNNLTCNWDVTGTQPTQPSGVNCWDNFVFDNTSCSWINNGSQAIQPTLACYESATFNTTTCSWDVTGTQPTQPSAVNCWDSFVFDNTSCSWINNGSQSVQPTLACYESANFNTTTCSWDVTGTQPTAPSGLACYETSSFNSSTCAWDVTGTQPTQPSAVNCWDNFVFDNTSCSWINNGSQSVQPTLACYESANFNTTTCSWDVTGTIPTAPSIACYETSNFNTTSCSWVVTGSQPSMPTLACYESANFNTTTCSWDVTGTIPTAPSIACYETVTFNTTSCQWVRTGSQPSMPTLACYETATWNGVTCQYDITGSQPAAPIGLACYETSNFNTTSCSWVVTGSQPSMPSLACYETANFNNTSCSWDVTGSQPSAPTGLACYETSNFNTTTCSWDITGSQPSMPTLACYESANFNTTTCSWDVTGSQPAAPSGLACYETSNFNTTSCAWDITGSQPSIPTLACYETVNFNTTTCSWDVTGTQPSMPTLACYESANFNTTTCVWDITGSQPAAPSGLACYETSNFNTTTCSWDITGSQPTMPTLACYETATFNITTCQWDVTGSPAVAIVTTETACGSYTWSANGSVYTQSGTYNYNANCQYYQLQLTVVNVTVSGISPSSGTIGATVVISGFGFTGVTAVQFNGTAATSFTVNNDGQITAIVPIGVTSGTITVIAGACSGTSSGSFNLLTNATLNLKAYIQGYYAGSGLMTSVLSNQGISTNTNEVDTITVELREATTGINIEVQAKGVINTDGTIALSLPGIVIGNSYYLVVKHRNAIQTWSAAAVTMTSTTSYDFTTASSKAFGDNMIEVETGVFAMYSGDINQDEFVDPFDYPSFDIDNINFESGYKATDLNGDGFIDPFDYPTFDINNINFIMSAHP
jgi:hypothetical protein